MVLNGFSSPVTHFFQFGHIDFFRGHTDMTVFDQFNCFCQTLFIDITQGQMTALLRQKYGQLLPNTRPRTGNGCDFIFKIFHELSLFSLLPHPAKHLDCFSVWKIAVHPSNIILTITIVNIIYGLFLPVLEKLLLCFKHRSKDKLLLI